MNNLTPEIAHSALDTLPPEMQELALKTLRQQHLSTIQRSLSNLSNVIGGDRESLNNIEANIERTEMRLDQVIGFLDEATYYAFNEGNVKGANLYISYVDSRIQEYMPEEPLPEADR